MNRAIGLLILSAIFTGCGSNPPQTAATIPSQATLILEATSTSVPTIEPSPTLLPSPTSLPTATPLPTSTPIVNDCTPNHEVAAIEGDVQIPEVDIISATSSLKGEILTTVLTLKGIPQEITINNPGVSENVIEHLWGVGIDTDGDSATGGVSMSCNGAAGFEYEISAANFKFGNSKTGPLTELLQANIWKLSSQGGSNFGTAAMTVDLVNNTITLVGKIPGINEKSKLCFGTSEDLGSGPAIDSIPCQ